MLCEVCEAQSHQRLSEVPPRPLPPGRWHSMQCTGHRARGTRARCGHHRPSAKEGAAVCPLCCCRLHTSLLQTPHLPDVALPAQLCHEFPSEDVAGAQGTCYGCGAALQTEQEGAAGYVEPEKYELKRVHRQLSQLVCGYVRQISMHAIHPSASVSPSAPLPAACNPDVNAAWHAGTSLCARSLRIIF